MKFDLDFEEKLICSTHRSSRKYILRKDCCFEGRSSTNKKELKGVWCQIKPKQQFLLWDDI